MPCMQKIYRCGKSIFVEKIETREYKRGEKRERRKLSTEEKQKENFKTAVRKLHMILNLNFCGEDYWFTLTYPRDSRPGKEQAKKNLKKFIGQLRSEYKKLGKILKWIAVTEWNNKSIHHHMVISGIDETVKIVRKYWKFGRPQFKLLDENGDYEGLAEYIVKETKDTFRLEDTVNKQMYSCSRNLKRPVPERKRILKQSIDKEPYVFKGYYLVKDSVVEGVNAYGFKYKYYRMLEIGDRRCSRKKE